MHVKEYLSKIIEKGKEEDMENLSCMLDEAIHKVKACDEKWFEKKCMELYIMAYGENFTEEKAEWIISNMKPYHMKWTLEQSKQVQEQYDMESIKPLDFWIVLNSAYNDFHDMFEENIDMYAKYVKNFIKDEDAKENKVFLYFTEIPKN